MEEYTAYSEQELLQGLREGDGKAFKEIYNRFFDALYLSAYRVLRSHDGAEDAVQDTFLSFWKYRENLQIKNLEAYLHQSVRNSVIKAYHKNKVDKEFQQRLAAASIEILHSENPLIAKELKAALLQSILSLPADQQAIYNLSRHDGLTYAQIASKLDISVKTVEKKMSLSLKQIRNELKPLLSILLLALSQVK